MSEGFDILTVKFSVQMEAVKNGFDWFKGVDACIRIISRHKQCEHSDVCTDIENTGIRR